MARLWVDYTVALIALVLVTLPGDIFGLETQNAPLEKRLPQPDEGISEREYEHLRNAHACIMSIVFIVLYPLGAISVHLPIHAMPYLRNTYLVKKIMAIHAPIQILGLCLMIAALAFGIRLAEFLGYFQFNVLDSHAHIRLGLVTCCLIIAFQPIMGFLQHRYFKKHGKRGIFGHAHIWLGRITVIMGIVNNGLGLHLATFTRVVPKSSYIRNFVLAGILVLIWWGLALYDTFLKPKTPTRYEDGEKGVMAEPKTNGNGVTNGTGEGLTHSS